MLMKESQNKNNSTENINNNICTNMVLLTCGPEPNPKCTEKAVHTEQTPSPVQRACTRASQWPWPLRLRRQSMHHLIPVSTASAPCHSVARLSIPTQVFSQTAKTWSRAQKGTCGNTWNASNLDVQLKDAKDTRAPMQSHFIKHNDIPKDEKVACIHHTCTCCSQKEEPQCAHVAVSGDQASQLFWCNQSVHWQSDNGKTAHQFHAVAEGCNMDGTGCQGFLPEHQVRLT